MTAHRIGQDTYKALVDGYLTQTSETDAETIKFTQSPEVVEIRTAAAETRTIDDPSATGQQMTLIMTSDGGDCTMTFSSGYNASGSTSLVFDDAYDYAHFHSIEDASGTFAWRILDSSGEASNQIDLGGLADGLVLDADGDTTLSAPTDDQVDLEVGGADVATITNPSAGEHAYFKLQSPAKLDDRETWAFFDDFNMKALDETNENWILNSGSDAQAVDPAVAIAERGTIQLVTGNADGTTAADASQLCLAIPVQADSGGLVFEARLNIATAITEVSVFFGLTDVTTLEEAFTGATATITSNATDAVGFLFDDGLTSKTWHMCGVDGDTDATTNGTLTTAPTADTYQVLRCEVDADGEGAEFFIDGTSVGSLTASVCDASTDLFLTCVACATTTTSKTVNVDYMYVAHTR